jgi:chromosome segregation ATPase
MGGSVNMKNIELKSLALRNFKGIKALDIDFAKVTNISGENATGKTSIFDAFTWLLFNKNSENRTDFDVKPLDSNNETIHGLEVSVEAILMIDGASWKLKKTMVENWVKKRGSVEQVFQGNIKSYEINDVPVKESDYSSKMNEFVTQDLFALLTNPLYFSTFLKWQDRRKILMEVLGNLDDMDVINYKAELLPLKGMLDKDLGNGLAESMTIDSLLQRAQATRRKLADDIKALPSRIDEASYSIKEMAFGSIEMQLRKVEKQLDVVQDSLRNNTGIDEQKLKIKDQIYTLKNMMRDFEHSYGEDLKKEKDQKAKAFVMLKDEINEIQHKIKLDKIKADEVAEGVKSFEKTLQDLRVRYVERNKEKLDIPSHILECPTCRRSYEASDVEAKKIEFQENFNQEKAKELTGIQDSAKRVQAEIERRNGIKEALMKEAEELQKLYEEKMQEHTANKAELEAFEIPPYTSDPEYMAMEEELAALEISYRSDDGAEARKELKDLEMQLKAEITTLKAQLAYKDQNERQKARIAELQGELKDKAQRHAEQEGIEFLCELFKKTKAELLESSINKKFRNVSFKLFSPQINGGMSDTCEALINGVPFSGANTASQIGAGIEIINTLNEHFQVHCPLFLDNRESVNDIPRTESQVISLIVSRDNPLKIS